MKIAVVAEFFYPFCGGQEQRLLEILEYVAKQGHKGMFIQLNTM